MASGTTRNPAITLPYERLRAIFRLARRSYNPTKYSAEVGDEEENPYEEADRRVAEVRDKKRAEAERLMEAEVQRRVAVELARTL